MAESSLHDIYLKTLPSYKKVYVVPLIRFNFPASDYLYLLYKPILDVEGEIKIKSISAINHWEFVWSQLKGSPAILHYHWLEFQDAKSLFGMVYKLLCIWLFKLLGGKLIWTIHNLKPHNRKWLGLHQKLHSWMAKKSDQVIVHSEHVKHEVVDYYSTDVEKIVVFPHPKFPATIIPKKNAIATLNEHYYLDLTSDDLTIGFFGAISQYKKIPETIELLDELGFSGKFLVFGYVKKGENELNKRLLQLAKTHKWFNYLPGFVHEKYIPSIMCSFDWFLINYDEFTTSGSFEMAFSYQRKIIAPKKSSILDYQNSKNVYLFLNNEELKQTIRGIK